MGDALQSLQDLYLYLTTNLSQLQAKYPSDPEKSQFMSQYVGARRNYFNSINKIFHDDDPAIVSFVAQMKKQESVIQKEVSTMKNVAKLLDDITTAVQIGAKLASLAG